MSNKLIFVIPDMGSGGAERVISILSGEMINLGYDVSILMLFGQRIHYELAKDVVIKNMNLMSLSFGQRIKSLRRTLKEISQGNKFTVYSFHDSCLKYVLAASVGMKRKVICSERNNPYIKGTSLLRRFKASLPYLLSDHVVFQTEDARRYYSIIPQSKCSLIPNPIMPSAYRWGGSLSPEKLISVCRLHPQKNIPMSIEVISILKKKYPKIRLDIYGEGILREHLEIICKANEVNDNVKFCGAVTNITERLSESSVFISTSDFEGISNSMLEAMSVGMPIVCTDCPIGGARMMLGNGAGSLSPVMDAESFAQKLDLILSDSSLANKLGNNALSVSNNYSPRNITQQWLKLAQK